MQLINETYSTQLVHLCEQETQRRWRRDELVTTEYQVLDTLLEWMASLPADKLTLLTATYGIALPEEFASELVGHIIDWGEPKFTDMSDYEWLGQLQSEETVGFMHEDFDDVFYYFWDEVCCHNEACQGCWNG